MKLYSYNEWKDAEMRDRSDSLKVKCDRCEGKGIIYEVFECCGSEREYECDCELCDGSGKVIWGELTELEKLRHLTRKQYYEQVLSDTKAYCSWTRQDLAALLVDSGFRVWQLVHNHELRISDD